MPIPPESEWPEYTWVVYLLRCRGDRLYTGVTNRLSARWQAHCAGRGARFTRSFPPEALLGWEVVADRSAALRREAAIRRLTATQKGQLAQQWSQS